MTSGSKGRSPEERGQIRHWLGGTPIQGGLWSHIPGVCSCRVNAVGTASPGSAGAGWSSPSSPPCSRRSAEGGEQGTDASTHVPAASHLGVPGTPGRAWQGHGAPTHLERLGERWQSGDKAPTPSHGVPTPGATRAPTRRAGRGAPTDLHPGVGGPQLGRQLCPGIDHGPDLRQRHEGQRQVGPGVEAHHLAAEKRHAWGTPGTPGDPRGPAGEAQLPRNPSRRAQKSKGKGSRLHPARPMDVTAMSPRVLTTHPGRLLLETGGGRCHLGGTESREGDGAPHSTHTPPAPKDQGVPNTPLSPQDLPGAGASGCSAGKSLGKTKVPS